MDILVRHVGSAFGREECFGGREGGKRRLTDTGSDFLTLSLLSFDMERQSMARTDRTSIAACTRIRLLPCPSLSPSAFGHIRLLFLLCRGVTPCARPCPPAMTARAHTRTAALSLARWTRIGRNRFTCSEKLSNSLLSA